MEVLLLTHDHDVIDEVATRIWHFQAANRDFKGLRRIRGLPEQQAS